MKKENGLVQVIVILILLAGLGIGAYLVAQKTNLLPKAYEPKVVSYPKVSPLEWPSSGIQSSAVPGEQKINSKTDLEMVNKDLDSSDLDSLDTNLSALDKDSADF